MSRYLDHTPRNKLPGRSGLDWCVPVCIESIMDSRKLIAALKADGWRLVWTVGSHHQFRHPDKPGTVTVPHLKRNLPKGTVNSVLKQAGLKQSNRTST